MKMKIVVCILVLAVVAFISGVTMLALATPGSQENPFITLTYLNDVFRPQMIDEIRNAEQELVSSIDDRIADLEARLEEANNGVTAPGSEAVFAVVTLSSGQSLVCSAGTEIMLRIGTATGFGTAPAIVDYTGGEALADGGELTTNHMYLVTIDGNGIRATAETVRVLVRGRYTVQ